MKQETIVQRNIFISYSHKDADDAKALEKIFLKEGWLPWIDKGQIGAGEDFKEKIYEGLRTAACVVLLWSKHAAESNWVDREITLGEFATSLIPVRLDDTPLPETIKNLHAVTLKDWDRRSSDVNLSSLLSKIAYLLAPTDLEQVAQALKEKTSCSIELLTRRRLKRPGKLGRERTEAASRLFSHILPTAFRGETSSPLETLLQRIRDEEISIVKIYGAAGTGKSSLLLYLYILALDNYYQSERSEDSELRFFPIFFDIHDYDGRLDPRESAQRDLENLTVLADKSLEKDGDMRIIIFVDGFDEFVDWRDTVESVFKARLERLASNVRYRLVAGVNAGVERLNIESDLLSEQIHFDPETLVELRALEAADEKEVGEFARTFLEVVGDPSLGESEILTTLREFKPSHIDLRTLSIVYLRLKAFADARMNYSVLFYEFLRTQLRPDVSIKVNHEEFVSRLSRWAYNFFVKLRSDDLKTPEWRLIHYNSDLRDYLIANRIMSDFMERPDQQDRASALAVFYNTNITRHCRQILNRSAQNQQRAVQVARKALESENPHAIANVCYFLGRIENQGAARDAREILNEQRQRLDEKIRRSERLHDDDLLALRTAYVSLIYQGDREALASYLKRLISDPDWNRVNRAFHLEYYHDQSIPSIDVDDPIHQDEGGAFPLTLSRLSSDIREHLGGNKRPLFELEVFSLYSLAQYRHAHGTLEEESRKSLVSLGRELLDPVKRALVPSSVLASFLRVVVPHLDLPNLRVGRVIEEVYRIKEQKRTGWQNRGIADGESVSDHMYGAFLLGQVFLPENSANLGYDKNRILAMILVHDLAESRIGDIVHKTDEDRRREDAWFREFSILNTYEDVPGARRIGELWDEFEHRQTDSLNAKIAFELDKLDCLVQLYIYHLRKLASGTQGVDGFEAWKDSIWSVMQTDEGRKIFGIVSRHFDARLQQARK